MIKGQANRPLAVFLLIVALATLGLALALRSDCIAAFSGLWGAAAYMWWRGTPASRR